MSLTLKSVLPLNHIDCIWCIKFHPTKKIFASCGSAARIIIWEYNIETLDYQKKLTSENNHKSTIRSLDWDYSGNYLSAASFDNNISIYKMTTDSINLIEILESNDSEIKSVSWSRSGNFISCCSRKGNIYIYEKDVDDFDAEEFSCKTIFEGHKGDIKMIKFCPNDDVLFSCGFDEKIKIWEQDYSKDDFVLINTISEHSGTVWFIEFNKNGNIFFTCSDDKSLIMWGIGDKNINNKKNGMDLGGDNNTEKIFDYDNIIKLAKIKDLHSRPIYSCSLNYNEKYIFTCSNDGNIGIIEIKENNDKDKKYEMKLVKIIKDAHDQYSVNCIIANKYYNKNEIITCGDDCNIKIWDFKEE